MRKTNGDGDRRKAGPLVLAAGLAVVFAGSAFWVMGEGSAPQEPQIAADGAGSTDGAGAVAAPPADQGVMHIEPGAPVAGEPVERVTEQPFEAGAPDGAPGLDLTGLAEARPKVPSGQDLILHEVLLQEQDAERWVILRYLAPAIARDARTVDFDLAEPDMDHLCATSGLAVATAAAQSGAVGPGGVNQILVTLMDRPVERGVADASVTQFNNLYRPVEGRCIWEAF